MVVPLVCGGFASAFGECGRQRASLTGPMRFLLPMIDWFVQRVAAFSRFWWPFKMPYEVAEPRLTDWSYGLLPVFCLGREVYPLESQLISSTPSLHHFSPHFPWHSRLSCNKDMPPQRPLVSQPSPSSSFLQCFWTTSPSARPPVHSRFPCRQLQPWQHSHAEVSDPKLDFARVQLQQIVSQQGRTSWAAGGVLRFQSSRSETNSILGECRQVGVSLASAVRCSGPSPLRG